MASNRPTNYGSTANRVPEVSFSGGGSVYDHQEVTALSEIVSKSIYSINNGKLSLEKSLKLIGTSKDSRALRDKMESTLVGIKDNVIKATQDIKNLKQMTRRGGWQQKLQVQKITDTFEDALKSCTPVEEQVVAKMRSTMLPVELAIMEQGQNLDDSENQRLTTTEMRQATDNLEFEYGLLQEREQRMSQIADTIIDIHQIMKEIGAHVHEQSEDIDLIENVIEDVHQNVEGAREELEKASTYQINDDTKSEKDADEEVASILEVSIQFNDIHNNNVENKNNLSHAGLRKKTCFLLLISVVIGVILATTIAITLRK